MAKRGRPITHGGTRRGVSPRLYDIWRHMHGRCEKRSHQLYRWYGARGVRVCDAWKTFEEFRAWAKASGYRAHLTIDRINPAGGYEPSNCQWLTRSENTRKMQVEVAAKKRAVGA